MTYRTRRFVRASALAPVALLLIAAAPVGEFTPADPGFAYSFRVTSSGDKGSRERDRTVGRVRVAGQRMRIDMTGKNEGRGHYILVTEGDGGSTMTLVRPDEREYETMHPDSLARLVGTGIGVAMSIVNTRVSGIKVATERLGSGGIIEGFETRRYRMTQDYEIDMNVLVARTHMSGHTTTEYWVAPELELARNPMMDFLTLIGNALAFGSQHFLDESLSARAKLFRGVPLRTISTIEITSNDGKVSRSEMRIDVEDLRKLDVADDVFEIPRGYKKVRGKSTISM